MDTQHHHRNLARTSGQHRIGAAPRIPIPSHRGRRAAPLDSSHLNLSLPLSDPQTHTRTYAHTRRRQTQKQGKQSSQKTKHIQLTPIPCRRHPSHHTSTPPHPCLLPTPLSAPVPVPPSPSSAGSQSSTNQQYIRSEVPAAPKNQKEHQRRTSQVLLHVGACHPSIHPSIHLVPCASSQFPRSRLFDSAKPQPLLNRAGDPFQRLSRLRPPSIPAHYTEQSLLDTLRPHILLKDSLLS